MRLLNTESLQFKEFFDSQIPKYAILSHRWGDEEVTLQEFRKGKKRDSQGYVKIKQCCDLADSRGYQWVWIDTCCIDKKSSAELSEAINSMWHWYFEAGECYAYLSDVTWEDGDYDASNLAFRQSVWFTRGWTLQELLAPHDVIFFDSKWKSFGTKEALSDDISAVTGISVQHLFSPFSACVAAMMSWVSKRATTRVEDMAYCMLGLFGVNMPLLYGEGKRAFMRLQLEIIKETDDESIFAWTSQSGGSGMLAAKPSYFAESGDIVAHYGHLKKQRFPYLMTNQGLEFQVPYRGRLDLDGMKTYTLPEDRLPLVLNCWRNGVGGPLAVTIVFAKFHNIWHRIDCSKLELSKTVEDSMSYSGLAKHTALIYIPQGRY